MSTTANVADVVSTFIPMEAPPGVGKYLWVNFLGVRYTSSYDLAVVSSVFVPFVNEQWPWTERQRLIFLSNEKNAALDLWINWIKWIIYTSRCPFHVKNHVSLLYSRAFLRQCKLTDGLAEDNIVTSDTIFPFYQNGPVRTLHFLKSKSFQG